MESGLYGARVGRRMVSRDKTHYANHEQLACSVMLPKKQNNSAQRLTTIWKRQAGARSSKTEAMTLGVGKRALTGVHKNAKTLQRESLNAAPAGRIRSTFDTLGSTSKCKLPRGERRGSLRTRASKQTREGPVAGGAPRGTREGGPLREVPGERRGGGGWGAWRQGGGQSAAYTCRRCCVYTAPPVEVFGQGTVPAASDLQYRVRRIRSIPGSMPTSFWQARRTYGAGQHGSEDSSTSPSTSPSTSGSRPCGVFITQDVFWPARDLLNWPETAKYDYCGVWSVDLQA